MLDTRDPLLVRVDRYQHGFSRSNRIGRMVWKVVESTAFRWSPPQFHAWRRWLLRLFGASIHDEALIYPTVRIWAPWNLEMHAHAVLGWGVDCYCVGRITLRERAIVSQFARLVSASHDIRHPDFPLIHRPIEIGASAWICAYAFVGMGLRVGEGAVVAATATLTRDVPDWTVVAGNPAKKIAERVVRADDSL